MACEDVQAKPFEEEAPKKEVPMRVGKMILDPKKIGEVLENEEKKKPANEPAEIDVEVEKDEKVQRDKPKTKSPLPNKPSKDKDKDHVDSVTVDIYEMAGPKPKAKKPAEPITAKAPSPKDAKKGGKTPKKKSKRTPHSKTPKKKKNKKKSHRKKKHE